MYMYLSIVHVLSLVPNSFGTVFSQDHAGVCKFNCRPT